VNLSIFIALNILFCKSSMPLNGSKIFLFLISKAIAFIVKSRLLVAVLKSSEESSSISKPLWPLIF